MYLSAVAQYIRLLKPQNISVKLAASLLSFLTKYKPEAT